uniref:Uncharacterized protein n=1 Tax=Meloidogyne javanica TaxID=6303 RepID=A0A915LEF7_MELJA
MHLFSEGGEEHERNRPTSGNSCDKDADEKWLNVMYNEEEEDESDEPENDEIIELGKDEDEYKQLRHEREEKKQKNFQCVKCESMQKSQARDLFLQKIGMAYDRGTMYTLMLLGMPCYEPRLPWNDN